MIHARLVQGTGWTASRLANFFLCLLVFDRHDEKMLGSNQIEKVIYSGFVAPRKLLSQDLPVCRLAHNLSNGGLEWKTARQKSTDCLLVQSRFFVCHSLRSA